MRLLFDFLSEPEETAMKLSEAIREGAKLRPQGFGGPYRNKERRNCSCVAEAALEAATGKLSHITTLGRKRKQFLELFSVDLCKRLDRTPVPVIESDLGYLLLHLNDTMKWTRGEIADWLEGEGY